VVQEGVWGPCLNLENVDEGILSFDVGKVRMMESRKMISDWSKYSLLVQVVFHSHIEGQDYPGSIKLLMSELRISTISGDLVL
jgi:hypothetical protein